MSELKLGSGYVVIDGKRQPIMVTDFYQQFGEPIKFNGYFLSPEHAAGELIPVGKPAIKNVIFNDPATIVVWSDGSKTVVKCQPGDTYSKETGLALCIAKKFLGNKGNFNDVFKKWIPEETEPVEKISVASKRLMLENFCDRRECVNLTGKDICPLYDYPCTCNFLKSGTQPMTDDEIRAAYKVVFGKEG